jgi:general stress protein 26
MSIEISDSRSKIVDFLTKNHLGVLATASLSGKPHAVAVYYVIDSDLNFFFITKENTEKHKNLQQNPNASLAVYDAKTQTTLQVDGQVTLDEDPQSFMNVFTQILRISMDMSEGAVPPISKLKAGEHHLYRLSPKNMRLAEYTKPEHGNLGDLFEIVNL